MSPTEIPQQRIHEVVILPERPEPFDCKVGYWDYPSGWAPKNHPRSPIYLCQVEWAWSPMHNRIDAYHLHRGKTHWSLWSRYWDDNWGRYNWESCARVSGVQDARATGRAMLKALFGRWGIDLNDSDNKPYRRLIRSC